MRALFNILLFCFLLAAIAAIVASPFYMIFGNWKFGVKLLITGIVVAAIHATVVHVIIRIRTKQGIANSLNKPKQSVFIQRLEEARNQAIKEQKNK